MERRHGVQTAGLREPHRFLAGGLEVRPMFDQVRALRPHGGVLLVRIAMGNDDRHRQAEARWDPVIEVHISNPVRRGPVSDIASVALGMVTGFGVTGYYLALRGLKDRAKPA